MNISLLDIFSCKSDKNLFEKGRKIKLSIEFPAPFLHRRIVSFLHMHSSTGTILNPNSLSKQPFKGTVHKRRP